MRSSKITMFMSEINYDIDYSIDLRLLGSINSGKIILTPKYPSAAISMRKLRILRININTSTELHPAKCVNFIETLRKLRRMWDSNPHTAFYTITGGFQDRCLSN